MASRGSFRVGRFHVDVEQGLLTLDGAPVRMAPKVFDLLALLAAQAPRVVAREALTRALWPDTTVEDASLAKLVHVLRHHLEAGGGSETVETVPKRGYRLIGDVAPVTAAPAPTWARDAAAAAAPSGASGEPSGTRPGLAVLPLTDLSGDGSLAHVGEGFAEEIAVAVARVPGLAVVGRTTVARALAASGELAHVGSRLGVTTLIEGTVRQAAGRLRVTVRMIDVATGFERWSRRFDGELIDVLSFQDEVAAAVATSLQLAVPARPPRRRPRSPRAYELYLQGRYWWNRRPGEAVWKALAAFEEATALAPELAEAWAGIADVYATLGSWEAGVLPHAEAQAKARGFAERALALDPDLVEAHTTLAYTTLHYDQDLPAAERAFRAALARGPGYGVAHHWYAHALVAAGRFAEAAVEGNLALALDPQSPVLNVHMAWHDHFARAPERVLERCERLLRTEPRFHWAHYFRSWGAEALGQAGAAVDAAREAVACAGDDAVMTAQLGRALAIAGDAAAARRIAEALVRRGGDHALYAYELALIHLALGERDLADAALARARAERSGWLVYAGVDPRLDPIRG